MNKKSVHNKSNHVEKIETKNCGLKTVSYTFGKEPKKLKIHSMKPGPGSYFMEKTDIFSKTTQSVSFAKSQRSTIISNIQPISPVGPGRYEMEQSFSKILPKSASVAIMKSKRFTNVTEDRTPGPGQYEIDVTRVKHQDPKWSLSKQSKLIYTVKENVPGPGAHNIKTSIGSGQKVKLTFYLCRAR